MSMAYALARPLLPLLPAEAAHRAGIAALRLGLGGEQRDMPASLHQHVAGLEFPSPVGLAAGFDKDAEIPGPALALGFGFTEVGTLTPRPQKGNPRPRLFRLRADRAVINRMGFNNQGQAAAAQRLARMRGATGLLGGPIGVNIGANKDSKDFIVDYRHGVAVMGPLADYLTINISSPNTPGLRDLQAGEALGRLLDSVCEARAQLIKPVPLFVKIAPDLNEAERDAILSAACDSRAAGGIDGLVISNTTVARPDGLTARARAESGGLSGRPLFSPSTSLLRECAIKLDGALTLIGVGGIASAEDAYAKIRAGATLVQLYTALIYEGPGLIATINQGLADRLERDGFTSLRQAVGADLPKSP